MTELDSRANVTLPRQPRCRVWFRCLAQLWHNAVTDNLKNRVQ